MLKANKDNLNLFRIKTFEEFGYERPEGWNTSGVMDYLYGRHLKSLSIAEVKDYNFLIFREKIGLTIFSNYWALRYEQLTPVTSDNEEFE